MRRSKQRKAGASAAPSALRAGPRGPATKGAATIRGNPSGAHMSPPGTYSITMAAAQPHKCSRGLQGYSLALCGRGDREFWRSAKPPPPLLPSPFPLPRQARSCAVQCAYPSPCCLPLRPSTGRAAQIACPAFRAPQSASLCCAPSTPPAAAAPRKGGQHMTSFSCTTCGCSRRICGAGRRVAGGHTAARSAQCIKPHSSLAAAALWSLLSPAPRRTVSLIWTIARESSNIPWRRPPHSRGS